MQSLRGGAFIVGISVLATSAIFVPRASFAQASARVDPSPIAIVITDTESAFATLFSWFANIIPHNPSTDSTSSPKSSSGQAAAVAASQSLPQVTYPTTPEPIASSATTTVITNTIIEKETPIVEYVQKGSPTVSTLSDPRLDSLISIVGDLATLMQKIESQSENGQTSAFTPQQVAGNGTGLSAVNAINQLSNTTISNPTITGGSISGTSIVGTIGNAIDTALATIDDLTSNTITATNVTFTNSTTTNAAITNLSATSATTSTLHVSATSTLATVILTGDNCSGYGNGGKLTTDAFGDVICAADQSGGAGSTVAGSNGQIQFNGNGSFAASSGFTFATSTNTLTVLNASIGAATTTNLFSTTASSTNLFSQTAALGTLTLATALPVSSGGTGATSLTGLITTADLASPNVSQFTNDAGFVTSSFSTTSASYWQSQNNFFSTTSASAFLLSNQGTAFSTTSANYLLGTKGYLTSLTGAASSTLLADNDTFSGADSFTNAGSNFAGTWQNYGPAHFQTALPSNNISQWNNDSGYVTASFSTTSATYWQGVNNFFSTTSAAYWGGSQGYVTSSFSTTSAAFWLTQNTGNAFSTTSANYILGTKGYLTSLNGAASSTLLADNDTFRGTNTFSNTITGSVSGNAGTATALQNAQTINNVSFNGTAGITITAASSTALSDANTWTGINKFTNVGSDFSGTWQTHAPSYFQTALGFTPYNATNPNNYIPLTSLSATYPLSYNSATGVFSSATSSAASAGVLSAADWTTFNNKQAAGSYLTGNQTITLSGAVSGSGATAITTSYAGTLGNTLGGTGQNSSGWTGLAGISAGGWYAISTSSALQANITGNAGTVTGGVYTTDTSTVTNTMLAGSIANAKLSHATIVVNSQTLTLGDTNDTITAASSTLLTDNNTFSGKLVFGNATTTNLFSTTASSTNLFSQTAALGTLTLATALPVSSGGTGAAIFGQGWIYSSGGTGSLAASTSPTVNYIVATSTAATSTIAGGFAVNTSGLVYNWGSGWTGVGTANPSRLFNVFGTAANPQERISYSSTAYTELQTDAAGDYLIAPSSGIVEIANGTLQVCSNSVCATPTVALSGAGNFSVENRLVAGSIEESCPSGYIWVPGESKYGTLPGFCTMQYVASQSGSTPVSAPGGTPWVNISQTSAIADCHAIGLGYHLMTDPEWMTIADETTALPINDLTGSQQFGTGASDSYASAGLTAGTSATNPVVSGCNWMKPLSDASNAYVASSCEARGTGAAGTSDSNKGYWGTGSNWSGSYSAGAAGYSQLRTKILPNGAVIWDMGGNIWQWTDAYEYGSTEGPLPANAWTDYSAVTNYQGLNIRPDISTWNAATNGIGQIYSSNTATVYAFRRGGYWVGGSNDGVFQLNLSYAPSDAYSFIGFRCSR